MTTELKSLTLGRMEYCDVVNHGKATRFHGTANISATLIENNIDISIWALGNTPDENTVVSVSLDILAITAMIGQLQTMKTVLEMRLEANRVA